MEAETTHQSVYSWYAINYCHHFFGFVSKNTCFIKLVRYQWIVKLAVP